MAGLRAYDEADFQVDVRGELRTHLRTARGRQQRLLRREAEADTLREAREHLAVAIRDVRAAQLELVGSAFRRRVRGERLHPDLHAGAVAHPQHIARPAAAAPVEALERALHVAVAPRRRVGLGIRTARGREPQPKVCRRLLDIDIRRLYRHRKNVLDAPAEEAQRDRTLCGEAVGVVLRRAWNAHVLRQRVILEDRDRRRGLRRIVGHEIEGELLVAAHAQARRQVLVGEDAAVGEAVHRTDERTARTAPQQVEVDALRTQRRLVAHSDLRDQLDGMPTGRKARHRKRETPVRRARLGDRRRIVLAAVHIERDDLRARTAHREGYHGRILRSVAARRESRREVVAARKRQRDNAHRDIRLLRLLAARLRVGRRGAHVDVRNAGLQVGRKVERIATLRNILNRLPERLDRTARGRDPNRRLLARGGSGIVTGSVLVVVGIGQTHRAALLDDGVIDAGREHDLRRDALSATTTARRDVDTGDLRTRLIRERQTHARLVLVQVGCHAEYRTCVDLVQTARDGGILHGIRGLRIQRVVDRRHRDIDVAIAVGLHLPSAVHRDAPHAAAELPPLCRVVPAVQRGADELVALPLPVADGERQDKTARLPFLPGHGGKGRRKRVVTAIQRKQRRHVIDVSCARTAAEAFPEGLLRPVVERRPDELPRLPFGRIDAVGDDKSLLPVGDAVVHLLRCECLQRRFQRVGGIAATGIDVEQRRAAQSRLGDGIELCNDAFGGSRGTLRLGCGRDHLFGQLPRDVCDILRFGRGIRSLRSGCKGHGGGILRRLRQQRQGYQHHLRALHGRKRVHARERRDLIQFQNALR